MRKQLWRKSVRRGVRFAVLALTAAAGLVSAAFGQIFTEFALPTVGSLPDGVTTGPDGNLWFTEFYFSNFAQSYVSKIGRITTAGVFADFSIPTADSFPIDIVSGPDGNLWFTEELAGKIGRITPPGVITEYPIPATSRAPGGIVVGPTRIRRAPRSSQSSTRLPSRAIHEA